MSFRFYNPAPVLLGVDGLTLAAGGSLTFYTQGTTTARDTWSDSGQTVLNPNPVPLDSSARVSVNVWLDGAYTVVLKDARGATVWTRDVDSGSGAGATIPSLETGLFLTNDGSNLLWGEILQVPDPADSANYILSTDGSNLIWIPQPTAVEPEIVVDNGATPSFRAGTSGSTTKFFMQYGTGTAPATGNKGTSASVTFPVEFAQVVWADIALTISAATPSGALVDTSVSGLSTTGFNALFNVSDDDNNSAWKISNNITFMWKAEGFITVEDDDA